MSRFKHSHVMGLIGVCLDTGSAPYIIMPYMANGSLLNFLKKERKRVVVHEEADEEEVLSFLQLFMKCKRFFSNTGERGSEAADGDVFPDSQWDGVSGS